jgi:hypothetical protein
MRHSPRGALLDACQGEPSRLAQRRTAAPSTSPGVESGDTVRTTEFLPSEPSVLSETSPVERLREISPRRKAITS